jgi:hypothetical protein
LGFGIGIGVACSLECGGSVSTSEMDARGDERRVGEADPLATFGKMSARGLDQLPDQLPLSIVRQIDQYISPRPPTAT